MSAAMPSGVNAWISSMKTEAPKARAVDAVIVRAAVHLAAHGSSRARA